MFVNISKKHNDVSADIVWLYEWRYWCQDCDNEYNAAPCGHISIYLNKFLRSDCHYEQAAGYHNARCFSCSGYVNNM